MSFIQRHNVTVTSDTTGVGSAATPNVTGEIAAIMYSSTAFSTAVNITVTTLDTSQTLWAQLTVTSPITVVPRQATHSTTGGALIFSTTGGNGAGAPIVCVNEKINVAVTAAGDAVAGNFTVLIR